ncbi:flagellar motor switch protein FliN/FliY [Vreelandella subterranea]|uniref:Flagellar motor switch protein FliN n=1 Tax=Vreelandella subterranea TaxID=416874 RepID=A0A1H9TW30_9GAMM|nr:flagellar motor switch protein FliN [Halomonas subterranea]SES01184.1 flagellar motor switch protein FliN/FliY [Halomonas subterranea]
MTDPNKPDQNISDDDWASAMSEQEQEETAASSEASDGEDEDPWAAAMAEQQAVEEEASAEDDRAADEAPASEAKAASDDVFRPLTQEGGATPSRDLEMIMDIPVKLTVELGRTKLTIKQLLELAQGSVIELDGLAGEPMDILINGYLVAQGEVVVIEDKYGIRITEIITPSERIHKLNR